MLFLWSTETGFSCDGIYVVLPNPCHVFFAVHQIYKRFAHTTQYSNPYYRHLNSQTGNGETAFDHGNTLN